MEAPVVGVAKQIGVTLTRVMFALAMFFAVFAPTMDALAKEDSLESAPTVAERVLAAFDVVDDVLDHMHGKAPAVHQQHFQTAPGPVDVAVGKLELSTDAVRWPAEPARRLRGAALPPPDHPPRS